MAIHFRGNICSRTLGNWYKQFTVAKLTGDSLTFTHCPLEKAMALLKDQIVSGSIEAKIFSPKP
jgi:hypothetical protein